MSYAAEPANPPTARIQSTSTGSADAGSADTGTGSTSIEPPSAEPSIGTLVSAATRDVSALVRAELELAKIELRADAKAAARGAVLFAIAGVFGFFLLIMLLIAFAEGLVAAGLWRWVAYLVVALVLLILAGIAAAIALRAVKKVKPPARTIETTKDTIAWAKHPTYESPSLRTDGQRTAQTVPPGARSTGA